MGGELRIRIEGDRTPPQLDGLEVGDGEWRLSLEAHRDLLRDLTGIDPDEDLTLQELVTIRARLEGYVERTKRPAEAEAADGDERPTEPERNRKHEREADRASRNPLRALGRVLERLRAAVSRGETSRSSADGSAARNSESDGEPPYSAERARQLAAVFRAAAAARRRDIVAANGGRTADETAK